MYKVYVNDKPVILTNRIIETTDGKNILSFHYSKRSDLKQKIQHFDQSNTIRKMIIINSDNLELLYNSFCSLFKQITAAGGIVYHPNKGMLWILRHQRWDLPKGKTEKNENIEEAAVREVEEETGIKISRITDYIGKTLHAYHEKGQPVLKTSYWYKMETNQADARLVPQTNEGITKVEWANRETIAEKINNTYASLQDLSKSFVTKYTDWNQR